MSKSLTTFLRNALNVKGTSEHSGRGSVMMYADGGITYDELHAKITELIPVWREKGLIENVEEDDDGDNINHSITFSGSVFDAYYRRLRYSNRAPLPSYFMCAVTMVFSG